MCRFVFFLLGVCCSQLYLVLACSVFFSSRRRHTRCALVTGVQTCALPISLPEWMVEQGVIGLAGIDTRALTRRIRDAGAPNGVIAHSPDGKFDLDELLAMARGWAGLEGMDLAKAVSRTDTGDWTSGIWALGKGYQTPFASSEVEMPIGGARPHGVSTSLDTNGDGKAADDRPHVVAIDYGAKENIFRNLVNAGASVTVVDATATLDEAL